MSPRPSILAVAVHAALHKTTSPPTPPPDTGGPRTVACANQACGNTNPPARIFCQDCTNRLRPELLEAIVAAYGRGAPKPEKARLIARAANSLRRKKPGFA